MSTFLSFPGKIHLITTDAVLDQATEALSRAKVLGFDTETRPSFKKGVVHKVALLQLSTEEEAYIIRLHYVTRFDGLKAILENPDITKVGVAIRDDLNLLQKLFPFKPESFVELQSLAKIKGLQNRGLKGMSEEVLGQPISKGPKTTNWELSHLDQRQLNYAATDAWVGLMIYQKLSEPT